MSKARLVLLSLVAVTLVSAVWSATAAAQEGPVWHVNGKKLEAAEVAAFKAENYAGSTATLSATILSIKVTIVCKSFTGEGLIIGGSPGKNEETIEFKECEVESSLKEKCEVTLEKIKAVSELVNLLGAEPKPILVAFSPEGGNAFAKVALKSKTGQVCPLAGSYEVKKAEGAQYGVACIDTHPEVEESTALIMCTSPAVTEVEHGGAAVKVGLQILGSAATFTADMLSKLTSGLLFGAWKS